MAVLCLVILVSSCFRTKNKIPEPNFNPYLLKPGKFVPATGRRMVNMDSVAGPVFVPAQGRYVKAGKPNYVPLKLNRNRGGKFRYVPAQGKIIRRDSVAEPEYVPARGEKTPVRWPRWMPARPDYQDVHFPFSNLGGEQGLNSGYVFSFLEARDGKIWIGTAMGGVSV